MHTTEPPNLRGNRAYSNAELRKVRSTVTHIRKWLREFVLVNQGKLLAEDRFELQKVLDILEHFG